MIHRFAALFILLASASIASAQEPGTLEAVERMYARWMKEHGVARGAIAIAHGDRLALAKGYGGLKPESRTLIASLSKAITGVCTATLIQQGTLRLDSRLGDVMEGARQRFTPRDPRLRAVTIEQLLTHRAGFGRGSGDPATGTTLVEVLGRRAVTQATMRDLVPGVLRTKLEYEPGTTYAYTNAPHLLLGVVIEAVTGARYEDHCASAVLRPQGIERAALDSRWAVLGSFGGWSLSGAEYLAFLRAFGPKAPLLSGETRTWMTTTPGYSLMFVRPALGGGHDFYHAGSWGYRLSAASRSGAINDSIGTRAMRAAFGASWYVVYEPRPNVTARQKLDHELYRTIEAIRAWPEVDLYPSLGVR